MMVLLWEDTSLDNVKLNGVGWKAGWLYIFILWIVFAWNSNAEMSVGSIMEVCVIGCLTVIIPLCEDGRDHCGWMGGDIDCEVLSWWARYVILFYVNIIYEQLVMLWRNCFVNMLFNCLWVTKFLCYMDYFTIITMQWGSYLNFRIDLGLLVVSWSPGEACLWIFCRFWIKTYQERMLLFLLLLKWFQHGN